MVYGVDAAAMSKVLFEANKAGVGLLHISDHPTASKNSQARVIFFLSGFDFIFSFNRYRTARRGLRALEFSRSHFFRKWEVESKEARSDMSTKETLSPVSNFFFGPVSVNNDI